MTLLLPTPLVSVDWLYENRDYPNLILLDATVGKVGIGQKPEFAHQWIQGAIYFDLDGKFSAPDTHLPHMLPSEAHFTREARALGICQDSLIVVYDKWGIYSAPRIWWMFRAMGHENVAVLDGGFPEWERRGFATQTQASLPKGVGDFTAHLQPHLMKNADQVLQATTNSEHLILDARPTDRFQGKAGEPRPHLRSGHMPNAKNLPFPEVIQDGKLLDRELLRAKFDDLGVANQSLIFTCGSGLTACIIELAAQQAGFYDTSVYDGSWSEWGEPGKWPVVQD